MTDKPEVSVQNMLAYMQKGWDDFQAFLAPYSHDDLTVPHDPAGWTAKDHIGHCAVWARGVAYLLRHQPRYVGMGLTQEEWSTLDEDAINHAIFEQHHERVWHEVQAMFERDYFDLMEAVRALTDADLLKPYYAFQPDIADQSDESPIWPRIVGNSFGHLEEHQPWIATLIGK